MYERIDDKFYGIVRNAKDGSLVPDDSWMCFLAKDNAFAEVLPIYRCVCERMGAYDEQLDAVDRAIFRVQVWRKEHPNELNVPDAKGERLPQQTSRDAWIDPRIEPLAIALGFCRDLATEELPHARVGTGAEVALRHIVRKANEALQDMLRDYSKEGSK